MLYGNETQENTVVESRFLQDEPATQQIVHIHLQGIAENSLTVPHWRHFHAKAKPQHSEAHEPREHRHAVQPKKVQWCHPCRCTPVREHDIAALAKKKMHVHNLDISTI